MPNVNQKPVKKTKSAKKGKAIATPIDTPAAVTISIPGAEEPTESTSNQRESSQTRTQGRKRPRDFDPSELRTLDDIDYELSRDDFLERPMSEFLRDLRGGIVSRAFKEHEMERWRKKKQKAAEKGVISKEEREALERSKAEAEERKRLEEEKRKEAERQRNEGPKLQETSNAPQVRIVDGQIVVDTDSLVIDRREDHAIVDYDAMEVVEETVMSRKVNSATYGKRVKSPRWSKEETEKFYDAISQFGTDFQMISHLLPGRTRTQVRRKFNREENENPEKIKEYLFRKRKAIDLEAYSQISGITLETVPEDFHKEEEH